MSITPQYLRKLLDEREASRGSRKRAWENLQEIRWVIKGIAGIDLPPPARRRLTLKAEWLRIACARKYRKLARQNTSDVAGGADFAQAVEELNKAIDRAEGLLV
jgi:hypothetical protein